jgi:large subunit ribosomal protein L15
MNISDVNRDVHKNRPRKRLGRGTGSGHGKTAGRGHKGQGARNGVSFLSIFQGGTMPLVRRVPKRGFNNKFARTVAIINLGDLDVAFQSGDEVTLEKLAETGIVKGRFDELKVLGNGQLTKKLKISAHRFSKSAAEKIAQAGGETIVLPGPAPVVKNKQGTKNKENKE